MAGKLVIMCTHGPESPERATIAFVMATAAQATDVEVVIGLQAEGVALGTTGAADAVKAANFPPLADIFAAFREADGKLLVCAPCMQARKIDAKDLVDGAVVVGAATFIAETMSAHSTLVY